MTVLSQSWEMRAGEDKSVTFTVPSDLTGCTASWTLREERGSPALLTKAGAVTGGASSTVVVALVKADTLTLAGVYWHQCVATDIALAEEVIAEGWVTILAAPAAGLYCSVETVKGRLGLTLMDQDAALERAIGAASRAIDGLTGMTFFSATATRHFTADDPYLLRIDDCLAITTLKTDDNGDRTYATTWAVTDFDSEPYNALPITRLRVAPGGAHSFPLTRRGVELAGSWGTAAAAPDNISEACVLVAVKIYKRKDSPFGIFGSPELGVLITEMKRDPEVMILLPRPRARVV